MNKFIHLIGVFIVAPVVFTLWIAAIVFLGIGGLLNKISDLIIDTIDRIIK